MLRNDGSLPDGLPPEGTIDIWQVPLETEAAISQGPSPTQLDPLLSGEERERAERFVFARHAARYRISHAVLRTLLGRYLGMRAESVQLTTGFRGKPLLTPRARLHFNLTHCEELALMAFSTIGEVGIDAEALGRDVEALEIATEHFTRNEMRAIAATANESDRAERFLRIWTRKEAVLKATGCGIEQGLDAFDVASEGLNRVRLIGLPMVDPEVWWLVRDLEIFPGYAAAVAAPDGDWPLRMQRLTPEALRLLFQ